MTGTGRRFAVIANAALDLRRRPDHRSELRSQLLAGRDRPPKECVRATGRWWEVVTFTDGYAGWVRTWGIVPATRAEAERWRRRATARVLAPFVEVLSGARRGPLLPRSLEWSRSSRFVSTQGRRLIELPDGRRGWIPRTAVEVTTPVAGRRWALVRSRAESRVARHSIPLGRPDTTRSRCSSFTQLVLAEQGIALPRDAALQFSHCAETRAQRFVATGRSGPFFGPRRSAPAHVGIARSGPATSPTPCGTVRVNSLDVDNPLCTTKDWPISFGAMAGRRAASEGPFRTDFLVDSVFRACLYPAVGDVPGAVPKRIPGLLLRAPSQGGNGAFVMLGECKSSRRLKEVGLREKPRCDPLGHMKSGGFCIVAYAALHLIKEAAPHDETSFEDLGSACRVDGASGRGLGPDHARRGHGDPGRTTSRTIRRSTATRLKFRTSGASSMARWAFQSPPARSGAWHLDRAMGAVLGNLFDGRFGTWAIHML
jgi:hypothetical protein